MIGFIAPSSGQPLYLKKDALVSESGEQFPILDEVPRFVSPDNYAKSFGLEWNIHALTQLDSHTGLTISRERLERCLGMPLDRLEGKSVLEAGCGAGRFTELMVRAGALVHSIDLSVAVEANKKNIGDRTNYVIAQADLLAPPFPSGAFDIVVCLGVLQHMPWPEDGIRSLWQMVKPGGMLVIDHYTWTLSFITKLAPLYRLILKRVAPVKAKKITDKLVNIFFPLHYGVRAFYPAQMLLSRISPCLVYFRAFPHLTKSQHYEWCRLDTFDHLTDYYKHLRTANQIRSFLESLRARRISVIRAGNGIEARCWRAE